MKKNYDAPTVKEGTAQEAYDNADEQTKMKVNDVFLEGDKTVLNEELGFKIPDNLTVTQMDTLISRIDKGFFEDYGKHLKEARRMLKESGKDNYEDWKKETLSD